MEALPYMFAATIPRADLLGAVIIRNVGIIMAYQIADRGKLEKNGPGA